jgi:benzoate membrane transport protein
LPLVLVTLTGQYLPGMAVLKTSGYDTNVRQIMTSQQPGLAGGRLTGGITIAIAAITAAMCTGPDAHEDPRRRYVAGIANGVFYLLAGLCGGSIVMLFAALPKELVVTLAGLALLGPIMPTWRESSPPSDHREASVITFPRHRFRHELPRHRLGLLGNRDRDRAYWFCTAGDCTD